MTKRLCAVRILGVGAALLALTGGVGAQTEPSAPPVEKSASAADDARIEAAEKEVQAYKDAYAKMDKEQGYAAAMRSFLTPDYREVGFADELLRTREQRIRFFDAAFGNHKLNEADLQNEKKARRVEPPAAPGSVTRITDYETTPEKVTALKNSVVVIDRVTTWGTITTEKTSSASSGEKSPPKQWKIVQKERKLYFRTPAGLRLKENKLVSYQKFVDGKLEVENLAPKPGK